ncbi:hypothetical protein [Domibacillus enclensis]|uniref:Uncharacterized protein n=1 Tax=Domibacillus enclensis TaxID=1017273 RepID=A0A1N6NC77_9BACI|nr:hypothetical protein [Domibacillus enclensis]SIP89622.1 hypothetical protein SAMN05443094_10198 [Domibacillus enclensis]
MQWVVGLLYLFICAVPLFFITLFIRLFKSEQNWHRRMKGRNKS